MKSDPCDPRQLLFSATTTDLIIFVAVRIELLKKFQF